MNCVFYAKICFKIQGGSNMTGTNGDLFTHNQSRSYLNHLVLCEDIHVWNFTIACILIGHVTNSTLPFHRYAVCTHCLSVKLGRLVFRQ